MHRTCQILVLAGLGLLVLPAYSDDAAEVKSSPEVLLQQQLDGEKKILAARLEALESRENVLKAQEALIDEKTRNQVAEHKALTESREKLFTYTTVALIGGVLLGWLSMMLMVHGWVRKQVAAEIERNSKHLGDIADSGRLENRLKQEARLLVLTGDQGDSGLPRILRNFGFDYVQLKKCPDSPDDIDFGEYTQVIFDNIPEAQLKPFVESGQASWYFAYNSGKQFDWAFLSGNKIAVANTKLTLYTRLMELLEWKYEQRDL